MCKCHSPWMEVRGQLVGFGSLCHVCPRDPSQVNTFAHWAVVLPSLPFKRSLALSSMLAQIFHPQEAIFSALAFWKAGTIGVCHSTKLWNLYFYPPQGILNSQSPDTRVWQASLGFLSGGNECLVSLNIGPFLPPQPKGWHWKEAKKKRKKKKAPIFLRT